MKLSGEIRLSNQNYSIKALHVKDEEIVQHLCEKCLDYFEVVEGGLPGKEAGHAILNDLPPDKSYSDKHVFGCFNEGGTLIAIVDIVSDYPSKGEWIIGLLMIDIAERGKGLGKTLHEYAKDYALMYGANKLRIGVVEENRKAYSFWSSLGYHEIKKVNMKNGNKDNTVVVMNLLVR